MPSLAVCPGPPSCARSVDIVIREVYFQVMHAPELPRTGMGSCGIQAHLRSHSVVGDGVQLVAAGIRCDHYVAGRIETGGKRPLHILRTVDSSTM